MRAKAQKNLAGSADVDQFCSLVGRNRSDVKSENRIFSKYEVKCYGSASKEEKKSAIHAEKSFHWLSRQYLLTRWSSGSIRWQIQIITIAFDFIEYFWKFGLEFVFYSRIHFGFKFYFLVSYFLKISWKRTIFLKIAMHKVMVLRYSINTTSGVIE